jgi:DNA repair protein RecO (recombination protein O)
MEWRDHGTIIALRAHGESAAIIEVFTEDHGRHAGVVRGGTSRRIAPVLQPGNAVALTWRARLDEHIGTFTVEPLQTRSALLGDRRALAGLNAVCALLHFALPERDAHPDLFAATEALLDALAAGRDWEGGYVAWELMLLEEMGFGLDLTACAVTGATADLIHVSPRSGRAVARGAAGEWADRMLPLPPCLRGGAVAGPGDLADALRTTGHFLEHRLAPALGDRALPEARARLVAMLARG